MKMDSMAVPLFETKNDSIGFAETNSRWCLAALCNAGDAIGLRRLHDRARHRKVSIVGERVFRKAKIRDSFIRRMPRVCALSVTALVPEVDVLCLLSLNTSICEQACGRE
jgi:hypothetical protein